MKIALIGGNKGKFNLVFSEDVMNKLKEYGEVSSELISKDNIESHKDFLAECEVAFATWGMIRLNEIGRAHV